MCDLFVGAFQCDGSVQTFVQPSNVIAFLAMIHLYCSESCLLSLEYQKKLTAEVCNLEPSRILQPLLETYGVNRDIDGLAIQVAYLVLGTLPMFDVVVAVLWQAMFHGEGPFGAYIEKGSKPRYQGGISNHANA